MRSGFLAVNLFVFILWWPATAASQRIGIVTPNNSPTVAAFAESLETELAAISKLQDRSLVAAAVGSIGPKDLFNLTTADSKRLASAAGCEYLIVIKSDTFRRASFSRADYYEAFAAIYLVSGRTGRLIDWSIHSFENDNAIDATSGLIASARSTASGIINTIRTVSAAEFRESIPAVEQVPDENSIEARGLRPPVPYKRVKPDYTKVAAFYSVQASVEIEVDLAATGEVTRTEIVRWAGYGLDESVIDTVKRMNWRPAMRNSKPLPMRVLLRYNFTKIDNDQ